MDGHSVVQNPQVRAYEVPAPVLWAFMLTIGFGLAVVGLAIVVSVLRTKNVRHGSYKQLKLPNDGSASRVRLVIDEQDDYNADERQHLCSSK